MTLGVGKAYPVLFDGAPATDPATTWPVGGPFIDVQFVDGAWIAYPLAVGTGYIVGVVLGARTGSVTFDIAENPIVITFGDPL